MRAIVLLLVGLVVGALLATSLLGAFAIRDRYPTSVMVVMQANLSALQRGLLAADCGLPNAEHHAEQLAALAREIPSAFASLERESTEFARSRAALTAAVDGLLRQPPRDCPALNRAIKAIAEACDGCHKRFR